jgi:peptide deformylase
MPLIITDEALLRYPCAPVKTRDEGGYISRLLLAALKRHNKHALRAYRKTYGKEGGLTLGAGLAAPQIGISKRVCIIKTGQVHTVLMNPVIVAHGSQINFTERCLSQPGLSVETYRYLWVEVDTLNLGRVVFGPRMVHDLDSEGVLRSIVAQHEIAHCYGLLMQDFSKPDFPPPGEWDIWRCKLAA